MTSGRIVLALALAVIAGSLTAIVAAQSDVAVELNADKAQPRQLEDTTERAVTREYASAWKNLSRALGENRADLLQENFVGAAQEKFDSQIEQQKSAGFTTKYIDHSHKLNVVFYSPEGSAIQFRDVADVELQILDGGKLVHSEKTQMEYVGLLTVTGDRWKVRVLQEAQ
jgi:hypothetical protein